MAHPIWTGTISFGLVAIPVSLVSAVKPSRVAFHLLHDDDFCRLRREMVCPQHEIPIPPEQWVRGHEEQPGKFVTISAEEMKSIAPKRSQTIEILDFVDTEQIPSFYYKKAYYLLPTEGAAKAYRLLTQVLSEQNRAGIAQFVMRERELLVAIQAIEEILCLFALYYYDEVTSKESLKPDQKQSDQLGDLAANQTVDNSKEIETIKRTIQQMSTPQTFASFPGEQIADTQKEKLRIAIEHKKQTGDVVRVPESAEDFSEGISEETLDEAGDFLRVLELHLEREKMQGKQ